MVDVTYDDVKLIGSLVIRMDEDREEPYITARRDYKYLNNDEDVDTLGKKAVVVASSWSKIPQNIKSALTTINIYLYVKAKEDSGLT